MKKTTRATFAELLFPRTRIFHCLLVSTLEFVRNCCFLLSESFQFRPSCPIWYWVRRGVTLLNQMTVLSNTLRPFTPNGRIFKHFSSKFHIFHLAITFRSFFNHFSANFKLFDQISIYQQLSYIFDHFSNRFRTVFGAFSSKN